MGRHLDYMHKKILASFVDPSSKLVLEAGVGTGRFATWLARKGFDVVGIDLSKEMLKKAKEKKSLLNVDVRLVVADVHFLPFRAGLFDGCICINVMDHFSDIDAFLKQVKHVVMPRGYFIFNFSNLRSPYFPLAIVINFRKRAVFKNIQTHWFTLDKIRALMQGVGFDVKKVKGCFVASSVPLGNKLVKVIEMVNFAIEDSWMRSFSGSLFVKATIVNRRTSKNKEN